MSMLAFPYLNLETEESEAQIEGGDSGQAVEDSVNDMIGEKDPAGAVKFYGVYTLSMGGGFALLWVLLNKQSWVYTYKDGFLSRITFYLAAGAAWLMVSFFDGEYMRQIYTDIQALSIFGPFFFHWYGWGMMLMSVLEGGKVIDWIFLAVWAAVTVVEAVFQISLLPQVFEWAETAPILSNDVKKEDEEEDGDDDEEAEGSDEESEAEEDEGEGDERLFTTL